MAIGERSANTVPVQQPEEPDVELTPETVLAPHEETPKKKKKKKKKVKVKEEEQEEPLTATFTSELDTTPELNETMNETNGIVKKKKKKKKDIDVKEKSEEVEVSVMEVHCSDSSGYLSDKSSKKRKFKTEITSGFSEESETPKSKKKRKTHLA